MSPLSRRALALVCLLGLLSNAARATEYSWHGLGFSNDWTDTNGNWEQPFYPGFSGHDDTATFGLPGSQRFNPVVSSFLTVAGISFLAPGYTLTVNSSFLVTDGFTTTAANAPNLQNNGSLYFKDSLLVKTLSGTDGVFQVNGGAGAITVLGTGGSFGGAFLDDFGGNKLSLTIGDGTNAAGLTLAPTSNDQLSTYSGPTTVNANATLTGGAANAFSGSSAHVVNGTLAVTSGASAVGSLTGSGIVSLAANTALTVNGTSTFDGTLTSAGGTFIKAGSGTFTLGGTSTGTAIGGGTTVRGGTLAVTGGITHEDSETIVGYLGGDTGTLTIASGSTVSNDDGLVAYSAGSTGSVIVRGTWTNGGDVSIGEHGTGTLTISAGGLVNDRNGYVGTQAGGVGTATIDGGTWTSSLQLGVGSLGTGTLTIQNGGIARSRTGHLGDASGVTGTVNINDGKWEVSAANPVTNSLFVGGTGRGILNVASAGVLTSTGTSIGDQPGSDGTVNVIGGSWTNTAHVIVGNGGDGALNVSGGGHVSNTYAVVGFGGTGLAKVDGGTWTSAGDVVLGGNGAATLTIQGGGTVTSGGTITLAESGVAVGTLNIGAANLAAPTTGGTLTAATVEFGNGVGTINFNQTDAVTFATPIFGDGTVTQRGSGRTTLTGVSAYTGPTTVTAGTLVVNGTVSASPVTVKSAGTLAGHGTLGAAIAVQSGGTLAPGDFSSTGQLTLFGSLTLINGAALVMEFGGTGAGFYDQLAVQGPFLAGGTLQLTINPDYTPAVGDRFTIFNGATPGYDAGSFTLVTNLGGGLGWDLSALASDGVVTVVPEPSTVILVLAGLMGATFLARRRA